jgi:hypothetical protein
MCVNVPTNFAYLLVYITINFFFLSHLSVNVPSCVMAVAGRALESAVEEQKWQIQAPKSSVPISA